MKGRITKDGALEIMRGGKWKAQFCAHTDCFRACGDWCPKFKEPKLIEPNKGTAISLAICNDTYWCFDDFTDERVDHVADAGKMVECCANCGVRKCCAKRGYVSSCDSWTPKKESEES